MKTAAALVVLFAFGCGDDAQMMTPDGPPIDSAPTIDAPMIDAPSAADAGPQCAANDGGAASGTHKIFLNFEGVTITAGASCNDARNNCSFIAMSNTTVPAFAAADANRAQLINSIVAGVMQVLAPFDVEVTTTRPTSGHYTMIVFAQCVSSLSCSTGVGSIGPTDCTNVFADDIAFVFEQSPQRPGPYYANQVVFLVGLTVGASTNQMQGDCMCDSCGADTLCTLSTDSAIHAGCATSGRQNEYSIFSAGLGCR